MEYVRYKNRAVSIGTCASLYYTSYDKYKKTFANEGFGWVEGNLMPSSYLNTKHGFRFRFPYPDEDKLRFGEIIEPYDRDIPITVSKGTYDEIMVGGDHDQNKYQIGIEFQKPVYRESDGKFCLAVVFRDCATRGLRRIEDDHGINLLIKDIVKHHVSKETDVTAKSFYRTIAARILKGYRIEQPQEKLQSENKTISASISEADKPLDKPGVVKHIEENGKKKKRLRICKR